MTSISRVTTTSTSEPAIAASRPSATPMTKAKAITETPMNSEMRAPKMMRDSMSRPSPSVPSGNAPGSARPDGLGAHELAELLGRRMRRDDVGEDRRQHDQRQHAEADHRAAIFAKRGGEGGRAARVARAPRRFRRRPASATSAGMADPRIDEAVDEVDQQIDEDDDRRDEQHAALQRRIVAAEDRLDEPGADAGPGEDVLRQHGAGHQPARSTGRSR